MATPLQDPRLVQPAPTSQDVARRLRALEKALGAAVAAAHRRVFPPEYEGRYTVTSRDGKVKVKFEPPEVKETGWVDA